MLYSKYKPDTTHSNLFVPSTALTPDCSRLPMTAVRWIGGGGGLTFLNRGETAAGGIA